MIEHVNSDKEINSDDEEMEVFKLAALADDKREAAAMTPVAAVTTDLPPSGAMTKHVTI